MFSQTNKLENYTESLDNLYKVFVEPMLEGKISGEVLFDRETPLLSSGTDTLPRCDYDAYKSIKNLNNKPTHDGDMIAYAYPEHSSAMGPLNEIINKLGKETGFDSLSLSNYPMHYKKYKDYNGFMGWHTNHDYPGDRWYFVYNTDNHSSFFRYIDPDTGQMATKWEPKGWCLNHFIVGGDHKPLWHCVYTNNHRISFGIRNIAAFSPFKQFKWKNVALR